MAKMNSELLCHYLVYFSLALSLLCVCVLRCFFWGYIWHIIEHPRSIAIKPKGRSKKELTINARLMVVCWLMFIHSHYGPLSRIHLVFCRVCVFCAHFFFALASYAKINVHIKRFNITFRTVVFLQCSVTVVIPFPLPPPSFITLLVFQLVRIYSCEDTYIFSLIHVKMPGK